MCDVTKASLESDPSCDLSILGNSTISSVTYDPVEMTADEAAEADDNYPYSTQYATKTRENLKFEFGNYDINKNLVGIRIRAFNDEDILKGKYRPLKLENKIFTLLFTVSPKIIECIELI